MPGYRVLVGMVAPIVAVAVAVDDHDNDYLHVNDDEEGVRVSLGELAVT